MCIDEGKPQIYGTQFKNDTLTGHSFLMKTIKFTEINKRRNSMGLDSIETYMKMYQIKYEEEDK